MGMSSTMTAMPARTEGPSSPQRKTMDRIICRGDDHSWWMKLAMSMNLWASADIRFTVSPTVDSLRVALDMVSAWKEKKTVTAGLWEQLGSQQNDTKQGTSRPG